MAVRCLELGRSVCFLDIIRLKNRDIAFKPVSANSDELPTKGDFAYEM